METLLKTCLSCERVQRRNYAQLGNPIEPKFTRGLCRPCYQKMSVAGTLDTLALPPLGPGAKARPEGSKTRIATGYVKIKYRGVWAMEHRHVMAQILGRDLVAGEN